MSKKGLSADEKKVKILEVFHETKLFYKLAELEKLAYKKGVVQQSVKEIIEELVADNQVHQEKIGIGVFFWSYPAERTLKLENQLFTADARLCNTRAEIKKLSKQVEKARASREEGAERSKLLKEYERTTRELDEAESKLKKISGMDPDKIGRLEKLIADLKTLTNHYTENVSAGLSWLRDEGGMMDVEPLRKELGIPDDFEDLELV